jgi:hypothetical protein
MTGSPDALEFRSPDTTYRPAIEAPVKLPSAPLLTCIRTSPCPSISGLRISPVSEGNLVPVQALISRYAAEPAVLPA